jgi:MFS family permease
MVANTLAAPHRVADALARRGAEYFSVAARNGTRAERAPARAQARGGRGIHYGWLVVGVLCVAMFAASAVRSMPIALILPVETEFGWSRATITVAVSISLLLFGVLGPLVGRLIDRAGPRVVALGAALLLAAGALGTVVMTEVWQLDLLWGFVIGTGSGGMAMVTVAAVVNRWFLERRGLVTGLVSAAISSGQIVYVPLGMWLAVTVGWRVSALVAAALLLLVVVPLLLLVFRDEPADVGLAPYGEAKDPARRAQQAALRVEATPMRQVFRSLDFWCLAGGFFVCGFTSNGLIGTHFIPHAAEHGISEVTAASIYGLMGGLNILGTIAGGMLCDRVPHRRYLLASYYALRGLGLFALPFVDDARLLVVFAVLFGLTWFATGSAAQLLAADRFGRRSVAEVYGWIFFAHQVGSASAATFGGLMHGWFGDYQLAFLIAGLTGLVAAGLSLRVREGHPRLVPRAAGG